MFHLRQSTASQAVLIGPFIDETDGITAMTGLTIANTDIRLSANGGNIAAKNSGGGTHDELGYYTITLDATDTATVGRLQLMVHATGALPVYHEFQVVEEVPFDAIYASSAGLSVTVGSIANNAITAAAIATGAIDADAIADNAIDAGAIASNAITAAKIATDAIGAAQLAADAIAEINATVDTALADYDGPTHAELVSEINAVQADIAALNDLSTADILTAALADAYAANGDAPTLQQAVMGIHQYLMEKAITGTTYSVKKLDGTEAFAVTLDDSTAPTASSRD
jgi:hypothetical protein